MLMYDYPPATDMDTVNHAKMLLCVLVSVFSCRPGHVCDARSFTIPALQTPTRIHATCLDRRVPTFLLFLDKQAAVQWTFAYNARQCTHSRTHTPTSET